MHRQPHVFEVRSGCLRRECIGSNGIANSPPQIGLPRGKERNRIYCVGACAARGDIARVVACRLAAGATTGLPASSRAASTGTSATGAASSRAGASGSAGARILARSGLTSRCDTAGNGREVRNSSGRVGSDRWKILGSRFTDYCSGCIVGRQSYGYILIRRSDLLLERIQLRIVEHLPPFASNAIVTGRGYLPAVHFLELIGLQLFVSRRRFRGRLFVLWADIATGRHC